MGVEAAREYHAERKRELAQKEKEEALEQLSPWSEQLQEAKREPIREPDHSVAILVAELAEALLRHERTINQLDIHIKASQDQEIARLRSRVDELEKRKGRHRTRSSVPSMWEPVLSASWHLRSFSAPACCSPGRGHYHHTSRVVHALTPPSRRTA